MNKEEELDRIAQEIKNCQKCPLAKTATNAVPGDGDPDAQIMLIGEAPGYWEDQKGIPFVGRAGKLLDELLVSINLSRQKVFTTNILKHRPPNNRDPLPEEIAACQPFLDRQIAVIKPEAFVTLGRFAMNKFLPWAKISRDHGQGKIISYEGGRYVLVPMYHPAAALRNPKVDAELRADFLKLPKEIEKLSVQLKPEGEEKNALGGKEETQLSLI